MDTWNKFERIEKIMIHTRQLGKQFGSITAVEDLTLDIQEGEVFGFLGPNGAGKTTTVRMLTTLIGPSQGTARLNGFLVGEQDREIRGSVGILTETPGMYDNLSAERNLLIYSSLYGVENPAQQVEKYLNMFGLWDRRKDPAGTFSKGMKQKLAITRCLLHEPKILFLDEPTAALDPEASYTVREAIISLRELGRTIFLCTHNLDEADRLCDRVAIFKTRLLSLDTSANLRTRLFQRKIVFHLAHMLPGLPAELSKMDFIKSVDAFDNKLILSVDDPETRNPQMIRRLVELGVDIQFVGEMRRSLEDVYLQLIQNDDQQPA